MTMITNSSSVPGIAKTFNENGWLETETTFENDALVGLIKGYEYYPGGELKATYTTTIDGVLTGQKRIYYPDGMLAAEENYAVGKLDGIRRTYWGSSRVDLQACKLGTGRRFTTS
jgi:Uncharacterized protein conserved in bacteria